MEQPTRGGYRAGAGRKRGLASIKAEEARNYTVQRIVAELEPILTGQIELAKGIFCEVETEEGLKTIYQRAPDPRVASYLLNQLIGHPKETAEVQIVKPFSLMDMGRQVALISEEDKKKILAEPH